MLVSIVLRFGNKWFLLCLEMPHAHWLSSCVSGNPAFSLGGCPSFPEGGSIFVVLNSDCLRGLEKEEASIVQMASNSFVILEINL